MLRELKEFSSLSFCTMAFPLEILFCVERLKSPCKSHFRHEMTWGTVCLQHKHYLYFIFLSPFGITDSYIVWKLHFLYSGRNINCWHSITMIFLDAVLKPIQLLVLLYLCTQLLIKKKPFSIASTASFISGFCHSNIPFFCIYICGLISVYSQKLFQTKKWDK